MVVVDMRWVWVGARRVVRLSTQKISISYIRRDRFGEAPVPRGDHTPRRSGCWEEWRKLMTDSE